LSQRSWDVRDYREGDEISILKLFRKVFGQHRSLEHWRWKFEQNPAGRQITVAVTREGAVIGHFAGLPVVATTPVKSFVMTQGIDHMVDPEWQRLGIYREMAQSYFRTYVWNRVAAAWYAFPDQPVYEIEAKAFGPSSLHPVPLLNCDLSESESWSRSSHDLQLCRIDNVERIDKSLDELWNLCRSELALATKRDSRYLNWRYADRPDIKYRFLVARSRSSGRPLGLAVLRFGWFDQPVAPLVDWLVPSNERDVARALIASCHSLASERKLKAMQASFPTYSPQYRFLVSVGYQPIASRCLITAHWPEDSELVKPMKENWYYTMGDSDMY